MTGRLRVLGGLALVALLLFAFSGTALAQPPNPTSPYYGFRFLDRVTLQRVANLLGTTAADVSAQLQQGKTLAQIAQAKGVAEKALTDSILQPFKDRLALGVKYGYLTQAQADVRLQNREAQVGELITTVFAQYGDYGYSYGFGCHGGNWGGMAGFGGMMGWW